MTAVAQQRVFEKGAIRPIDVSIPEAELFELRRRIDATRCPERETVADDSQGVQLETIQEARALLGGSTTTGAHARPGSTRCRTS